jgi:hypothetical protein
MDRSLDKGHHNKLERRLSIQQSPLFDSMMNTIRIYNELREERMHHIMSIENKHNRKIYDNDIMFIDEVVEHQGKEEFAHYINNIKNKVLRINGSAEMEKEHLSQTPKYSLLHTLHQMATHDG